MSDMQFELVAKCQQCGKEVNADIDSEHAFNILSFRIASHLLEFSRHEFRVVMKRENREPKQAEQI